MFVVNRTGLETKVVVYFSSGGPTKMEYKWVTRYETLGQINRTYGVCTIVDYLVVRRESFNPVGIRIK